MDIKNLSIVVEAIVAGFSVCIAIFGAIRSRSTTRQQKRLRSVLLSVPRVILEAEKVFLDGHGEEKRQFAICLLKEYCSSLDIDYNKYSSMIEGSLEDVLSTPQKKLEVNYEENQKQS